MLGFATVAQATANTVLVVAGERLARYGFGAGHPFGTDRHDAFWREFNRRGLQLRTLVEEPRSATPEELRRFHSAEYVEEVRLKSRDGQGWLDSGDTPAYPGVFEDASTVVGAALGASEALMSGRARRAFIPIAGLHHAARHRAAGFCVFNDIGVVIETLLREGGLQRVGYVDIDAHHGDGVFYGFETDPRVIFADLHEDGRHLYPGTGAEAETGRGVRRLAPSSIFRCRRARMTRYSPSIGRGFWPTCARLRRNSSFCNAAPTAWRATRSPIWPGRPSHIGAPRGTWVYWPMNSDTAVCWRWAAGATTAAIWRPPGTMWSRR